MVRKHLTKDTFEPGHGYAQADWDEVSADADSTDEELAQPKPFAEAFLGLMESIKRARMAEILEKAEG